MGTALTVWLWRLFFSALLLLWQSPLATTAERSPFPTPRQWEVVESAVRRIDSKQQPADVQEAAARGVLRRLLPTHVSSFKLKIISKVSCDGYSCFKISNLNGQSDMLPEIMIEGTSAVEISAGLHWYLKYWCGAHISWDKTGGIQTLSVPPPGKMPRLGHDNLLVKRPVPWSYYQNVVTSSYSFAWWDWKRWEKEIDWMALQGVNLPLAFTGQESIWQKVFKGYNISSEDLKDFFGGPAFLAWARMGNLHGWGGPLSQNWLDQQLALQKRILFRMRELGMVPVLPSFSGNVPAIFKKIFPSANITRLGDWNCVDGDPRWCFTYLLDPSDPLFVEVGEAFIKQQIEEYGDITDIYNCDTFNENEPPTNDPLYISSLGSSVYKAMSKADEDAMWLMQGWLFFSDSTFWKPEQMKALLHSVPFGKMVVLDLFADVKPIWKQSLHFYGVPYIWCMLHNFGGNIEMYGRLDTISSGPIDARVSENSSMIGVGMCMEGIEHNPVVYELMSEMAFRSKMFHVEDWLQGYSVRRYGYSSKKIEAAWRILYQTIYNCSDGIADHNRDFIVHLPVFDPSATSKRASSKLVMDRFSPRLSFRETSPAIPEPHLWYSTNEVIYALKLFIDGGITLKDSSTYRYDLVDLTRQVLAKLSNQIFLDTVAAYQEKDVQAFTFHSNKLIELIKDIDALLASNDNFLLGTWLESAKRLSLSQSERKQYEWNARTQITMWFDNTATKPSKLQDYANKYWSGLLTNYYLPRVSCYFKYMLRSLEKNESFALGDWLKDWISYSNRWQEGIELYPVKANGDAIVIAKKLVGKYVS